MRSFVALAIVVSLAAGTTRVGAADPPGTTTTVTVEATPSGSATQSTSVTFTAHVVNDRYCLGGLGTVTFQFTGVTTAASPAQALGSDPNCDGIATYQTSTLNAGVTHVVAHYSGSSNSTPPFDAHDSTMLDYTITGSVVGGTTSTTSILAASGASSSSSMLSVNAGDNVTFTVTVADGSGATMPPTPTGNVRFYDGATPLAPAGPVTSGVATFSTTALTPGPHSVTAQYAGDATYAPSTSTAVTVTVAGAPLSNMGSVSPASIASGFGLSLNVTITGPNPTAKAVSVDLTAIGLGPTALAHRAGAAWGVIVTVPNAAPVGGPYSLPVTLTDQSNIQTTGAPLSVSIIQQARGIGITPGDGTLTARTTKRFSLTATYTNGQTGAVTAGITWRTGSTDVATVDANGFVTVGQSGSTTLTALYGGLTTMIPITVVAGGPPVVPAPRPPGAVAPSAATSQPVGNTAVHPNGASTPVTPPNPAPPRH